MANRPLPDIELVGMLRASVGHLTDLEGHAFDLAIASQESQEVAMLSQTIVNLSNAAIQYRAMLHAQEGQFHLDDFVDKLDETYADKIKRKQIWPREQ